LRSGKFNYPVEADYSINLLMKIYKNLSMLKYDIKLVPISIAYDRIYDASHLANEMISG